MVCFKIIKIWLLDETIFSLYIILILVNVYYVYLGVISVKYVLCRVLPISQVFSVGTKRTLCRVPMSWLSANSCLPERCTSGGFCQVQLSAKALPAVIGPLPSVRGTRRTSEFQ